MMEPTLDQRSSLNFTKKVFSSDSDLASSRWRVKRAINSLRSWEMFQIKIKRHFVQFEFRMTRVCSRCATLQKRVGFGDRYFFEPAVVPLFSRWHTVMSLLSYSLYYAGIDLFVEHALDVFDSVKFDCLLAVLTTTVPDDRQLASCLVPTGDPLSLRLSVTKPPNQLQHHSASVNLSSSVTIFFSHPGKLVKMERNIMKTRAFSHRVILLWKACSFKSERSLSLHTRAQMFVINSLPVCKASGKMVQPLP